MCTRRHYGIPHPCNGIPLFHLRALLLPVLNSCLLLDLEGDLTGAATSRVRMSDGRARTQSLKIRRRTHAPRCAHNQVQGEAESRLCASPRSVRPSGSTTARPHLSGITSPRADFSSAACQRCGGRARAWHEHFTNTANCVDAPEGVGNDGDIGYLLGLLCLTTLRTVHAAPREPNHSASGLSRSGGLRNQRCGARGADPVHR